MRRLWLLFVIAACGEVLEKPDAGDTADADPCIGTCECRVDTDCSDSHAVCDDQVTTRSCTCAAGYAPGTGGACEWSGVVGDPGFQAAGRWTGSTVDVAVDPNLNVTGMIDPGAARFSAKGMCDLARITQTVDMPRLSRAQPLVVEVAHRITSFMDFNAPAIGIGPSWHDDVPSSNSSFRSARICLGSAQYAPETSKGKGAPVEIVVMPTRTGFSCNDSNSFLDIDHFEIKPANPGECAAPGTALNGDAEAEGGWQFQVSNGSPPDTSSGRITDGSGEGNTRGARLLMNQRCRNVSLTNQISIPVADEIASPAFSVFNRTSVNARVSSSIGGLALPQIAGSGTGQTLKMCVPAFMRGGSFQLFAGIDGSGTCADVVNFESVWDNLKIINDPTCGTDTTITDPGFESTLQLIGARATPGKSLARALSDAAQAHAGTGVLQLSVTQLCDGPSWEANVVVPPSSGANGPALRFFYKAQPPTNPPGSYRFSVNTSKGTFTPIVDNQYHEGTICLDPKFVGRNVPVTFSMSGGGGTCANIIPVEQAFVDDLSVTTLAGCPAQ
jgi:hypothetical protein